jgi:hypothetical protein
MNTQASVADPIARAPLAPAAIPRRLRLGERELELRLTAAAERQLAREHGPLDFELELYFSCLIRKRVHCRSDARTDVAARAALTPAVSVSFRPVIGRGGALCEVAEAPLDAVQLARPQAFTPKWLALDYRGGSWRGDFGY